MPLSQDTVTQNLMHQTWVGHKPSQMRSPLTLPQSCQNLHGTRKQTLGGHKQNLVHTRTQEKGAVTHKRLTQNCLCVSKSFQWRHGLAVACCRVGGTECPSACMGPFEGGHHYLHYLHRSLASGQITGREHSPTHQQKIGLKMALPITQDPVSPSVSLSYPEASISLLSLSIRGQTE